MSDEAGKIDYSKWPTVAVGIESIYGMGGETGAMCYINIYREVDEDNNALVERTVAELKKALLKELDILDEYREGFEKRFNLK